MSTITEYLYKQGEVPVLYLIPLNLTEATILLVNELFWFNGNSESCNMLIICDINYDVIQLKRTQR